MAEQSPAQRLMAPASDCSRSRGGAGGRERFDAIHQRPVATTLLTFAITLAGAIAYTLLPVSPLPQVDFPTIFVSASLPGGSPEVMAASVATPLEKQFTRIAGVTEMTSNSSLGSATRDAAVRSEPRYQCGRARRAGGHQRRARRICRRICRPIRATAR